MSSPAPLSDPQEPSALHPWRGLIGVALVLGGLALAWRVGPLREWASENRLASWLTQITATPLGVVAAVAVFTVLATLMVPLMAMVAATALALPLSLAVPVSIAGALASASIAFALGRSRYGRDLAAHLANGARARRAFVALGNASVLAMAGVRLVPVAPFTVVNLAAGSCGVSARSFLLGTVIGLAPGITVLSFAANRTLASTVAQPSPLTFRLQPTASAEASTLGAGEARLVPLPPTETPP